MAINPQPSNTGLDPYFPEEATEPGFPEDASLEEEWGEEYLESIGDLGELPSENWEEDAPSLDARQRRLLKWLDRHDDEFQKTMEELQTRYESVLEGSENLSAEDRLKKAQDIEATLKELQEEIAEYEQREKLLVKTGLSKDWIRSQSEGLPDPEEIEEFNKGFKELEQGLENEIQKNVDAQQDQLENLALSQETRGLVDFLSGSNGKDLYFSANADGRSVKEVYRKDSRPVEMIFTLMADALKADNTNGWDALDQYLRGLAGSQGQTVAVMAATIIQENLSQLWEKLPTATLRTLAQGTTAGEYMHVQRVRKYTGSNFMGESYNANTRRRGVKMSFENGMDPKKVYDLLTAMAIEREKVEPGESTSEYPETELNPNEDTGILEPELE